MRPEEWIVVIIDDEQDNLMVASTALQFHGAMVHTCTSGKACLELLPHVSPTFILLDIAMPHMDGLQLFRTIRETEEYQHIPVIALTAHVLPSMKKQVLDAGFAGFIPKPYAIDELIGEIKRKLTVGSAG